MLFFPCWQAMFWTRSDYFRALIDDHFHEGSWDPNTSRITIPVNHVEPAIFAIVVCHVYSNVQQVWTTMFVFLTQTNYCLAFWPRIILYTSLKCVYIFLADHWKRVWRTGGSRNIPSSRLKASMWYFSCTISRDFQCRGSSSNSKAVCYTKIRTCMCWIYCKGKITRKKRLR